MQKKESDTLKQQHNKEKCPAIRETYNTLEHKEAKLQNNQETRKTAPIERRKKIVVCDYNKNSDKYVNNEYEKTKDHATVISHTKNLKKNIMHHALQKQE